MNNTYTKQSTKLIFCFLFLIFLFISINYCLAADDNENLNIYCNNSLLMDAESRNVLFEKKGYLKTYPASTTKVLTAILALENLNLDDKIVISKEEVNLTPIGSSVMGVKAEEIYSVENILYGLLLASGNDAAIVLADAVSGNQNDFVDLMNEKAKEIGCNNTHFTNPHGFFDENHYSTAYDMSLILQYALKYDEFRKISETKSIELPATTQRPEPKIIKNTNRLIDENYSVFYEYALGGKTGYTIESRGTYVGYAKKDDKFLIVANFDGSQNINGQNARFLDAITLYNYGFQNFNKEKIIDKNDYKYVFWDKNLNKKYEISLKEDIYSLTKGNNYIISVPKLNISNSGENLTSDLSLHLYGNNIDITKTYETVITNSTIYISLSTIIMYLPYVILVIFLVILVILIKKIRK